MVSKSVHIVIILLSVLFSGVQYNDPDAFLWIVIYLYVAVLAFLSLQKKIHRQSLMLVGVIFVLWGINQFPKEWEGVLLNEVGMKTINIELGRESLGLFINATFCVVLALLKK